MVRRQALDGPLTRKPVGTGGAPAASALFASTAVVGVPGKAFWHGNQRASAAQIGRRYLAAAGEKHAQWLITDADRQAMLDKVSQAPDTLNGLEQSIKTAAPAA